MVESLRQDPLAVASDLHVFCDAPRKPEHAPAVAEVRRYVRKIDGFHSVTIIEREHNFGLARSIQDGVTRLCDAHGCAVVVEDDLQVAPDFLGFLNRGLDRYAGETGVYQISAYMYPCEYGNRSDALFLPMISCWGWATWKRAWDNYDPTLSGYAQISADATLRQRFDLNGAYDYFEMATQQRKGTIDSWGICWHMSVFIRDGLVLYPRRTLVQNIGVDASGTHGGGHSELQLTLGDERVDTAMLRFPSTVQVDKPALRQVEHLLRSMKPGLIKRFLNWIRK